MSLETVNVRPGNVLVAVRNPNSLDHLKRTLDKTDTRKIACPLLREMRRLSTEVVPAAAPGGRGDELASETGDELR